MIRSSGHTKVQKIKVNGQASNYIYGYALVILDHETVDLSAMLFGIDAKSIDLATSINYETLSNLTVTLDHSATNVMALVSIYVLHESTATFIAKCLGGYSNTYNSIDLRWRSRRSLY